MVRGVGLATLKVAGSIPYLSALRYQPWASCAQVYSVHQAV